MLKPGIPVAATAAALVKLAVPIASVVLLLAATVLLRQGFWTAGSVSLLLACATGILGTRGLEPLSPAEREHLRPLRWRLAGWLGVLLLVLFSAATVAADSAAAIQHYAGACAWAVAVVTGLALIWLRPASRSTRSPIARCDWLIAAGLLAASALTRLLWLDVHPYPWSGDEASVGSEAARILNGEIANFFATGWSSQPNWSFLPTAFTEALLGRNIVAVRLPSVLAGMAAVLMTYVLGRDLFGRAVGAVGAVILATLPYHVHFSRIGVHNVLDSVMAPVVLWLAVRAVVNNDARYYYTAGAISGLCLYTYAGTRLVPVLLALVFAGVLTTRPGYLRIHRRGLGLCGLALAISGLPQMVFFLEHPDIAVGRLSQEGLLLNGWLVEESARTGRSIPDLLWSQTTATLLTFVASSAHGGLFNSPRPYLNLAGSVLFLLGGIYAVAFWRRPQHLLLLMWLGTVVVLGGILTLNPPAHTRLLMATPPTALLAALGAARLVAVAQLTFCLPARAAAPALGSLAALVAVPHTLFYLSEYRAEGYLQDPSGEYAMQVGLLVQRLDPDMQVFVMGSPRVFSEFPTLPFLVPAATRSDLTHAVDPAALDPGRSAGFFAIPENRWLLGPIRHRFPGGRSGLIYRKHIPAEVLFEYYVIPQAPGPGRAATAGGFAAGR